MAWLLGGLLVLVALAWLAIPPLAKWQIESRASQKLGRGVTVERLQFEPWRLGTRIEGLRVAGAAGQGEPLLTVRSLGFRTAPSSLWRGAPVIEQLRIDGPRLRLARVGEGRYDVDDLIERLARPDDAAAPARFVLRDLGVHDGAIDFDDSAIAGAAGRHAVRELEFVLPSISSLDADRDGAVQPRLSFNLDGSRFDSSAQALPFAQLRRGEAELHLQGLDLARLRAYWPAGLPVRPAGGTLDARLQLRFAQGAPAGAPSAAAVPDAEQALDISGTLNWARPSLLDAQGRPVLAAEAVQVQIASLAPWQRRLQLHSLVLRQPRLALSRDAAGRIGLPGMDGAAAPASASGRAEPAPAWNVSLDTLQLRDGHLQWRDAAVAGSVQLVAEAVQLDAASLAWPPKQPVRLSGSARLRADGDGAAPAPAVPLAWSGEAAPTQGRLQIKTTGLPLDWARAYLQPWLRPALSGRLGADATVAWGPDGLRAEAAQIELADLALLPVTVRPSASASRRLQERRRAAGGGRTAGPDQAAGTLAGARRVRLEGLRVDVAARSLAAARLDVEAPTGRITRDARGRWMFEDWLAPSAAPAAASATSAGPRAPAWTLALASATVREGRVGWRDEQPARPVALDLERLRLSVSDLRWPQAAGNRPLAVELESAVLAGASAPGSLRWRGQLATGPLALDGRLDLARLPLHALEPYFGDRFNVQLVRADLGFAGRLRLALPASGLRLQALGDIGVENGRVDSATPEAPAASPATAPAMAAGAAAGAGKAAGASTTASIATSATSATSTPAAAQAPAAGVLTPGVRRSNSLFTWRSLQMRHADLRLAPAQPVFWGVHEIRLSDFFARLAIDPSGRLNLRDLARRPAAATAAGAVAAAADASGAAARAGAPELHFGQTHFSNGRVQFTDSFIQPAYSAALSELEGVLGAFDSAGAVYLEPAMATLELRGKAEGTAALDIRGRLNPLADPLAIDLVAKVDELDLPALSPYALKYMGHGIERGKLSVAVHYKIEPDGRLLADNSLVLRQLVFEEGGSGSLPVRLAAALLADRQGVIDLNLPISGSINDPQFSLAPVIGKALLNLVVRAVSSPFSLVAGLFSGAKPAAERSTVAFAPGSSRLGHEERLGLDGIARALVERPGLQLTIAGAADGEREAGAMRQERLRQLARYEKRRALAAAGPAAAALPPVETIEIDEAEYPGLLQRVYEGADMPKPRNLVGMARKLPHDEMERLLAEQVDVTPESVRSLALARAAAVRDYLAQQGVPSSRLFLGAVRVAAEDAEADWKPHARLRLALP